MDANIVGYKSSIMLLLLLPIVVLNAIQYSKANSNVLLKFDW